MRSSARFAFFFECLAAALAMVLMYRHRPRAPAVPSPSAPPRRHWVRVAVASAAGGAIMGALSAIRPADFGGFDIPQPARLFAQIPLGAAVAAFIGCWLDLCRRSFEASSRGGRAAALVLASVVIALIAPRIYLATSAWALPGLPAGYGYKTRYYTYFAVAGLMPLVTVRVAPRSGQDPQRRLRLPAGQHALLLFALSFGAAALANGVAIAGARLLQPAIMPAGESGFFKPMSAWGLLLVSAPALLGVSLGLSHGDERPLWLQRLHATLVDALEQPDPVRRAASCRSLIAALCQRHLADPASLRTPAAAPLGHHIGWLLQGFADSEADLDQLAARLGRSPAQVRASLPELVAALEDAVAAAPEPLRATLEVGLPELTRLRVTLVHEPPGPTSIHAPLVLVVDGRLTDPQAVASVTAHLEEVLSALTATERRLLAGARILAELRVAPGASWASTLQVMPLALGCGVWAALSPPDTSGREARCAEAIAHAMPGAGTGEAGLAAAALFDALRQGDR
ncbi:MAG: hypothetical protein H6746_01130 [Deltaproteobacteria bacterium]|nr:hypothetical protein [Deltaproteobacteria bacterium]